MRDVETGPEIARLIELLSKLPGYGPRSARRAALVLLRKKDQLLRPLGDALLAAADRVQPCSVCGSFDTQDPCALCRAPNRDDSKICVVKDVGDLWALERSGAFKGRYHVLGGVLSALEGIGPSELNIGGLVERAKAEAVKEVIIALDATVDGQTTAHYIADLLEPTAVSVSRLAHGVPVGGELDHLDDGTLLAALSSRRAI